MQATIPVPVVVLEGDGVRDAVWELLGVGEGVGVGDDVHVAARESAKQTKRILEGNRADAGRAGGVGSLKQPVQTQGEEGRVHRKPCQSPREFAFATTVEGAASFWAQRDCALCPGCTRCGENACMWLILNVTSRSLSGRDTPNICASMAGPHMVLKLGAAHRHGKPGNHTGASDAARGAGCQGPSAGNAGSV